MWLAGLLRRDVLAALDRQFDLPDGTIASITAAELPALIGQLTPEGRLCGQRGG